MSEIKNKYDSTIIYMLSCKDLSITDLYVGHTTNFKTRKYNHKSDCSNELSDTYNSPVYKCIRNNGGWTNWEMVEIELVSCLDIHDAKLKERYYIELFEASLNAHIPSRPHAEYSKIYRSNNKEKELSRKRIYREDNREKLREDNRIYRLRKKQEALKL